MTFIVGTGPTELHAHIDLDHRITATIQPGTTPAVTVLAVEGQQSRSEQQLVTRGMHIAGVLDLLPGLESFLPLVVPGHRNQGPRRGERRTKHAIGRSSLEPGVNRPRTFLFGPRRT